MVDLEAVFGDFRIFGGEMGWLLWNIFGESGSFGVRFCIGGGTPQSRWRVPAPLKETLIKS